LVPFRRKALNSKETYRERNQVYYRPYNNTKLKARDIKNKISSELKPRLSSKGFKFNKTTNEFRRSIDDYSQFFCIDQLAWSDHFSLNVRLYISQKKVEDVLETILGRQRHRFTIGGDIARIKLTPDGRTIINGGLNILLFYQEDISAAIDSLYKYYKEIAEPYFTKYNDLKTIDDLINNEPFEYCPAHVGGNYDNRCMKGLIVAKLVKSSRYEELVKIYDREIKETFNNESIQNYSRVREYLNSNEIFSRSS
jgi:hypothetical protein